MDALKLAVIFAVILLLIRWKNQLALALAGGTVAAVILYRLPLGTVMPTLWASATSAMTLSTLLSLYAITYLQRLMEAGQMLTFGEKALDRIFGNRRLTASVASVFVGVLPSAGAITLSAAIVDSAAGDSLTPTEKAFTTSYYRHLPESFMPTFPGVIVGLSLSGIALGDFLLAMLPVLAIFLALGYGFFLRKIPKGHATADVFSAKNWKDLFAGFWPILLISLLAVGFQLSVWLAVLPAAFLLLLGQKQSPAAMARMATSAFEGDLLGGTLMIMLFKDILVVTGTMEGVAESVTGLALPPALTFFFLFFIGSLISGQQSMNAIGIPLVMAAAPSGGVALFTLVMCAGYLAMQISPTHICLPIVTQYFDTSMGAFVRKGLPVVLAGSAALLALYFLCALRI